MPLMCCAFADAGILDETFSAGAKAQYPDAKNRVRLGTARGSFESCDSVGEQGKQAYRA